jgi:uncharacterized cupin superfamily protein
LNLRDASWETLPDCGSWVVFQAGGVPNQIGAGAHVLPPGESTGFYHREGNQEGFLVLQGECVAIIEGTERILRQWDFFHCPPETAHIMVGGRGEEPCVLFMFGNRLPDAAIHYEVDPAAAKYGASVEKATDSAREAYGVRDPYTRVPSPWPRD